MASFFPRGLRCPRPIVIYPWASPQCLVFAGGKVGKQIPRPILIFSISDYSDFWDGFSVFISDIELLQICRQCGVSVGVLWACDTIRDSASTPRGCVRNSVMGGYRHGLLFGGTICQQKWDRFFMCRGKGCQNAALFKIGAGIGWSSRPELEPTLFSWTTTPIQKQRMRKQLFWLHVHAIFASKIPLILRGNKIRKKCSNSPEKNARGSSKCRKLSVLGILQPSPIFEL